MSYAASAVGVSVGIWWTANTSAHLFIHRPFFHGRAANACTGAAFSAILGFPQAVWRDRHLAHHADRAWTLALTRELALQTAVVAAVWLALAAAAPSFFLFAYLPGYAGALLLCAIHGHYEHAGGTTSHYGRLYNKLCFNDGYHAEHHRFPGLPWRELPARRDPRARTSRFPAPLRWMDGVGVRGSWLDALERLVLRSPLLQRVVVGSHARALRSVLASTTPREIAIVGGGLFPRTALILRELFPAARLTIIDVNRENLDLARALLHDERIEFLHARWAAPGTRHVSRWDVVIIPLAFDGDRDAIYASPPARAVVVHDWIWRRRGTGCVVSLALLKRINLVRAAKTVTAERRIA